jgi:hypothetical protein
MFSASWNLRSKLRGIAERNFERKFQLAENIHVRGANLVNGLLYIDLEPAAWAPLTISRLSWAVISSSLSAKPATAMAMR